MNYKLFKYLFLILISSFTGLTYSQIPSDQPVMVREVYKTKGLTKLKLYIYQPSERNDMEKLPVIVFFYGGALEGKHTWQFEPQGKYLVEHGMVAVLADYRVKRNGAVHFESIADAKSAIRWIREHANEFDIDENRIAAGGGSAGGYLAACAALVKGYDEQKEDLSISSVPNALVLFNPRLDLLEVLPTLSKKKIRYLKGKAIEISPIHNVKKGAPPTIIYQGTADESVLAHTAPLFCEEMKKYGNDCEVVLYEGREHGFFLKFLGDKDFTSTMEHTVKFLTSIGYIKSDTTIGR